MTEPVILRGDARHLPLPDNSVDLVVTSPPYYNLRAYVDGGRHYEGQIGAEATPGQYLDALIECTREMKRVLKPTGSIFLNLGDKYAGHGGGGGGSSDGLTGRDARPPRRTAGIPAKSLMGLPWRYALRCVDELGLILRRDQIWSKANAMPESVTDRTRSSHEYVFHLTKSPRYYAAIDELREPHVYPNDTRHLRAGRRSITPTGEPGGNTSTCHPLGKLPGSVWNIPTQPLRVPPELGVTHFAAFPPELPRRIITCWCPREVCTACGEGRRPVASSLALDLSRPQARRAHQLAEAAGLTEEHFAALLAVGVSDTGRGAATQSGTGKNTAQVYALAAEARRVLGGYAREYLLRRPTGFTDACACPDASAPATPGLVVDPFSGTGTAVLVATALGRQGIGIDASADYCHLAQWRCGDPKQRARAAGKPPAVDVPAEIPGQMSILDVLDEESAA